MGIGQKRVKTIFLSPAGEKQVEKCYFSATECNRFFRLRELDGQIQFSSSSPYRV